MAAAGEGTGSIFVWSIRTGRLLDEFPNHESAVVRVSFSPISCRLLSCSWDGSAVITDFTDMEKVHREALESSTDMLTAVWRPDGNQIATSNLAGKIGFWEPKQAKLEFEIDATRDIRAGRPKGVRVSAATLNDQEMMKNLKINFANMLANIIKHFYSLNLFKGMESTSLHK